LHLNWTVISWFQQSLLSNSTSFVSLQLGTHFQCGFLPQNNIALNEPVETLMKTNAQGDCRDVLNLNLVMMLADIVDGGAGRQPAAAQAPLGVAATTTVAEQQNATAAANATVS
jgi:hypothetical protein